MNLTYFFPGNSKRLGIIWRVLTFIGLFLIALSPLMLIKNSTLQYFGATIMLVLALFLNAKYLDKRAFSDYGLVITRNSIKDYLTGILIGTFAVSLILFTGNLFGIITASFTPANPDLKILLVFGVKMVFVAIMEESIYRGYFYTNLNEYFQTKTANNRLSVYFAVLISSLLFGLAHTGNQNASIISVSFLMLNGIIWCIPFILTRNLGLSIGMHFSWNFCQTFFGFTMSGNKAVNSIIQVENAGHKLWTGGEYGPEAGLLGMLGMISMLLLTLIYVQFTTSYKQMDIDTIISRNSFRENS